jgi:DNA polymerase III subunit beta
VTEERPVTGFIVKRFHLLQLLERVATVVSTRNINPLLGNFCVTVMPGKIRIAATDMELSVLSESVLVTCLGAGTVLLPADKFLPIVRQADEGDVEVRVIDGIASIIAGRYSGSLLTEPSDDYPALPGAEEIQFTMVRRDALAVALAMVKDAACRDGTNPRLMAVNIADGKVTAASHTRLHQVRLAGKPDLDLQIQVGAADELARLLASTQLEEVGVGEASGYMLAFRLGDDVLMAGKLPEAYPDQEKRLLSTPLRENKKDLTADKAGLLAALARVRITADKDTAAVGLRLADGKVTVTSRDKWGNGGDEEISASWSGGERMVVVNHQHLTDLLSLAAGPRVTLWLGSDTGKRRSPLVLNDEEAGSAGVIGQLPGALIGEK